MLPKNYVLAHMMTPEDNVPAPTTFVAPPIEELDELLDGYKFNAFISQGGMGAVYKATQTSLERPVAIKVLPVEFGADETFRDSFQHEARLMAKLNNPNLIGVYDFGDMDGMLYIIMEFVEGKSLFHSSHGKAIVQDEAGSIIRDVCIGLQHAHDAGILHRDIKPANILLGADTKPKIGDFGLARPAGSTETGVIYGTPGYTAPEVIQFPEKVDERADIFAVGVMFYELLTGQLPPSPYVPVTQFVECDSRFDNIIRKAINQKHHLRYSSAQALADDISEVLKDLEKKANSPKNRLLSSTASRKTPAAPVLSAAGAKDKTAPVLAMAGSSSDHLDAASPSSTPVYDSAIQAQALQKAKNAVVRNLVIITLLLVGVYFTWEWAQGRKDQQAIAKKEEERIEADKKAERERKRKEHEERLAEFRKNNPQSNKPPKNNGSKNNTANKNNNTAPNTGEGTKPTVPTVTDAPPIELVEKARHALFNGERPLDKLPKEIFKKDNDSRILLFIDKPMTWHEADQWCQEHGGYLGVCRTSSDWHDLTKRIAKREGLKNVWLGGGTSSSKAWAWVDDTKWGSFMKTFPSHEQKFLSITNHGIAEPQNSDKRYPFFIEWRMDGTNPGYLDFRLQRTNDQLGEINPLYLPGTVVIDTRHYYIAHGEYSYDEAKKLAETAGGHLLVPRTDFERKGLETLLSSVTQSGNTYWIGGKRKQDLWVWETNEPWQALSWDEGYPKRGFKLAIVNKANIPVRDLSSSDKTSGFIIEWSDDFKKVDEEDLAANSATNNSLTTLRKKAKQLIQKEVDKAEAAHESNVDRVSRTIRLYLKSLPKNEMLKHQDGADKIISAVKGKDRVPESLSGQGGTERIREVTTYAVDKQKRIDQDYKAAITKLRSAYISQLQKLHAKMNTSGQSSAVKAINEEGRAIGEDADSFLSHFGF